MTLDLTNIEDRVISRVLRRQADRVGDDLFLMDESGAAYTFAEVDELADRYASALADLGIQQGDTVALFMESTAETVLVSLGANRLGAIWTPANTDYRGEWLQSTFEDMASSVLVVDRHLLPRVTELPGHPFAHVVVNGAVASTLHDPALHDSTLPGVTLPGVTLPGVTLHDLASFRQAQARRHCVDQWYGDTNAVLWTSGTTGRSKGVMQPNNVWISWAEIYDEAHRGGIRPGERFYSCTPLYNSGAWSMNIYPALIAGAPVGIDLRFSVSKFWHRVRHYRAQHTLTFGTMQLYLHQRPPQPTDSDNPLRTMVWNPVIPEIHSEFKQRFGIERINGGFGQSEVMGVTLWSDGAGLNLKSAGLADDPRSIMDVTLVDENDLPVPEGEIGQICVRGKRPFTMFSGYFNRPQDTVASFRNQWHHTGDLGRIDEAGELFFVDRQRDSTRHKGRNVSGFEVEHIARQYPGVALAAAVGIAVGGIVGEEELMIALVPVDGHEIDPLEFCKFMDSNAPYFFVPRFVHVTGSLPMTPTAKIQKFKLRAAGLPDGVWDLDAEPGWAPTKKDYSELRAGAAVI